MRRTNIAPHLFGAAALNKFRIYIRRKLTRDMHPPNPSSQRATTRPARAKPQIIKIMIISVLKDAKGDPLVLFSPSMKFAIPKTSVKITSKVPMIRSVHLMSLKGWFVFIMRNLILVNNPETQIYTV
jgi:hypothetical protein